MAASPTSRTRRAAALPLGLALTAALAFLPGGAYAAQSPSGAAAGHAAPAAEGPALSYLVNARPGHGAAVRKAIAGAGGSVVVTYDRIGVTVAHSADPDFARRVRRAPGVQSAGATRTAPLPAQATADTGAPKPLSAAQLEAAGARAGAGQDPLEGEQWDLRAIKADKAHERTLGSKRVTVAVIDTGVDDTHPDIAPNFDRGASASCASGRPDTTEGAWRPATGESPHGTHVASEIAAAKNGVGITGVAPGVRVAGIKVADPDGFFYAESVVCGFMWAAGHGVDVTNNSYYTDPWYFNCTTDPDQKALVEAVTRASAYAEKKGAVNVAAAGNEEYDLAAPRITDPNSPNDSTPADREVDTAHCFDIPTQLPGVVTVAATGAKDLKSSYSNYGEGIVDIAAPGGDSTAYQPPAAPATNGSVLGALPGGQWGYMSGTSMATPHVVGVVALLESAHPHANPAQLKRMLYRQADATPCTDPYDIDGDGKADAVCEGGTRKNGFYGVGIADALRAVQK
ncbi:S8 family serine peptidase [Streptomyces sp. NPDC050560]|uniref:S8 family serine peptidase n=1 Tax=Streptomyces sp. NPDC050560 TaxID=3365630 RepID=UPI00378FD97D